jgi:hypothetical protein
MTPEQWLEFTTLTDEFARVPDRMPLARLQRLDVLTQQLALDPHVHEARRLVAILTRAAVKWWLSKRQEAWQAHDAGH